MPCDLPNDLSFTILENKEILAKSESFMGTES